ncbi:reverse transcriptase domain-containing protein, partial [Tanacetum coccineum]
MAGLSTYLKPLIGQKNPRRNDTGGLKKAQGMWEFALKSTLISNTKGYKHGLQLAFSVTDISSTLSAPVDTAAATITSSKAKLAAGVNTNLAGPSQLEESEGSDDSFYELATLDPPEAKRCYRECMRTRRSNYPNNSNVTIPRRRRKQVSNIVEPEIRTIVEMAERTMEELLRAPTEGYGEAIVLPEINADHFEIKTNLLQLVQANPFYGRESENPHAHINSFKRITSTLRFRNVPNDVIKLMMFPYSLEGAAKTWYEKEPPNSILTWEDLVTKFVNQFFPPSKTTHLKNEISRFTQKFEETFSEAWEQFKEFLRACPHHGFTELTQVDTFYNGLNENEQDSLNATAGGNLLSKTTREALNIIENKSKVRYS